MTFFPSVIYCFLVALGIVIGASLMAGVGALINNQPPLKTMADMSSSIKIWAIAAAMGGTFTSLEIIEKGLFKGEPRAIIKQVAFIVAAIWGANTGSQIINLIDRCGQIWLE